MRPLLTAEEIAWRGEEIYVRDLRVRLKTEENGGKFLIIDIETRAYERDKKGLAATERLLSRNLNAMTYGLRIGYEAAYELDEHLPKLKQRYRLRQQTADTVEAA